MVILFWIAFGVITGVIASNKGRSTGSWFLYGLVLGPIALVHALVTHSNADRLEDDAIATGVMRKCPYCAELVKAEAIVCRFCQRDLPALAPAKRTPRQSATSEAPAAVTAEQRRTGLTYLGIAMAVILAIVLLSSKTSTPTASDAPDPVAACAARGVKYFKEVEMFPRLDDGRDATAEALERCNRTTTAF